MKSLLSTLMIATVLGSASYAPKSNAGIVILGATGVYCAVKCVEMGRGWGGPGFVAVTVGGPALIGTMPLVGGAVMIAAGGIGIIPGAILLAFSEDGSVSQEQLEANLSEKYNFIADREVISTLASTIKSKADLMEADAQGMKMVSLSEDEVKSILSATELNDEEIALVVKDLGPAMTATTEVTAEEKVNGMTFIPKAE